MLKAMSLQKKVLQYCTQVSSLKISRSRDINGSKQASKTERRYRKESERKGERERKREREKDPETVWF